MTCGDDPVLAPGESNDRLIGVTGNYVHPRIVPP